MASVLGGSAPLTRWDGIAATWVNARTTPEGLRAFAAFTNLGSPMLMFLLGLAGAAFLWRRRPRTMLAVWAVAFTSAFIIDRGLKEIVHRARPPFGTVYLHGQSFSFPSGHALLSMVAYGMLAYALPIVWPRLRPHRILIWCGGGAMIFLIGVSRVYLGVHYPSDVLAGSLLGALILLGSTSELQPGSRLRRPTSLATASPPPMPKE